MKTLTSNSLRTTVLMALITLLIACGGGGGDGGGGDGGGDGAEVGDSQKQSNPDFIAKAQAISFSRVRLYEGHINPDRRARKVELDTSRLSSGDLMTVDVEFEIAGEFKDYSVSVQLVPESIFSLLDKGNTIGEIINENTDTMQGEGIIDLGGAYIDEIKPGILHGVVYVKLPVLAQDTIYKVIITPELNYLSSGKEINESDVELVPVFLDDREFAISKLDRVSVKVINTPDLTVENDFTQLEIDGKFDKNSYSIEPIFQTSVNIDITTFNKSEEVALSLFWLHPSGKSLPLGLLSKDAGGKPVISPKARFTIEQTDETTVTIPVVAYAPITTYTALLGQATKMKDIADQDVQTGKFKLNLFYAKDGRDISAGKAYDLSLPLVSQDNRLQVVEAEKIVSFTALRAGSTNSACLYFTPDIDTGLMPVGGSADVMASQCTTYPNAQWRYDFATRQIISKVKDANMDSYCLTAIKPQVISGISGGGNVATHVKLQKCIQPNPVPPGGGFAGGTQEFEFIKEGSGYKIKSSQGDYLDVDFPDRKHVEVTNDILVANTFFTDTDGVEINRDGRIFYVGKFYDNPWGSADKAQVRLSYGAESYVEYLPVIGAVTQGHAILSASLFGESANLINTSFALKRHLSKKTSVLGNNYPDVVVYNGAQLKIDVTGFVAIVTDELKKETITETYDPLSLGGDALDGVTGFSGIKATPAEYKMEEEFLDTRIIIVAIPVAIKGGVEGKVNVTLELDTPSIGVDVKAKEVFDLSGFLSAGVDVYLASVGIKGTVEIINQEITLSANGGFNSVSPTAISFDIGSTLSAELKLLRGKVDLFLEYPKFCLCKKGFKKAEKTRNIYSSPYLFDDAWEVYSEQMSTTIIDS